MVVSQVGEADSRLSAAQALHNSLVLRTKLSACLSSPVMTGVAALCCLPSSFEVMALHAGKKQKPGSPGLWHQQSREEGPCSLFSGLLCCSTTACPAQAGAGPGDAPVNLVTRVSEAAAWVLAHNPRCALVLPAYLEACLTYLPSTNTYSITIKMLSML